MPVRFSRRRQSTRRSRSFISAGELKAMTQQALDFNRICLRMLPADSFPRDLAGKFMQLQSQGQSLLAGHSTIELDLRFQCPCRSHMVSISNALNFESRKPRAEMGILFDLQSLTPSYI